MHHPASCSACLVRRYAVKVGVHSETNVSYGQLMRDWCSGGGKCEPEEGLQEGNRATLVGGGALSSLATSARASLSAVISEFDLSNWGRLPRSRRKRSHASSPLTSAGAAAAATTPATTALPTQGTPGEAIAGRRASLDEEKDRSRMRRSERKRLTLAPETLQ